MTWEKVGLNITNIVNMSAPNISVPVTTPEVFAEMNTQAQSMGIWFEVMILTALLIFFTWALSEISPFTTFKYNYMRAVNLALGMTCLLGISYILTGFFDSYRIVAIFLVLDILSTVFMVAMENRE